MPIPVSTTLNAIDKGADLVLSADGLTVTGTPAGDQLVRSLGALLAVKGYCEAHCAPAAGNDTAIGLCTAAATGPRLGAGGFLGAVMFPNFGNGTPYVDGTAHPSQFIGAGTNATIQVAFDLGVPARPVWFRVLGGDYGGWNGQPVGSSSDDPVAGTSSLSLAAITDDLFVVVEFAGGVPGNSVTLNFGASPWAGVPPTGFARESVVTTPEGYALAIG